MLKLKPKPLPKKKPKKKSVKEESDSQHIRLECTAALKRFINVYGGGRFSKKRLIYSRPWFLMCGPVGSGKTTLLNQSDLSWDAMYPDELDGEIQWRFGKEAVWIDLDGSLLEDSGAENFRILLETLARIRPRRPLDGIIMITDCGMMLDAEMESIKNQSQLLRKRIDQITRMWGLELPVYTILSKTDKITGFNAIFSDPKGKWNERALGASLDAYANEKKPKELFLEELFNVLEWIKVIQVKMLARDKNQANRRLICQFPIMLESLREKISRFIEIIYKKSDFTGTPLFGGFFFTSCRSNDSSVQDTDAHIFDISKTIVNHPLYPPRKKGLASADSSKKGKNSYSSFFIMPLFTSVIPNHVAPITTTKQGFRQNIISLLWKSGTAIAAIIIVSLFEWKAATNVRTIEHEVLKDFSTAIVRSTDGIKQLGRMHKHYLSFKRYAEKHRTFSMFVTRYDAKRMYEIIEGSFFSAVYSTIIEPCAIILKDRQERMVHLSENSPENNFIQLKQLLRTYLAISDSNRNYKGLIDEKIVTPILYSMAKTSIFGIPNVTGELDTILTHVLDTYVSELKNDMNFKYTITSDNNLVASVRDKLVKMFDVDAVYSMVRNKLVRESKNLKLIDIVGNDVPLNMRAEMMLSEVYTPNGWNGNVKKRFNEASSQRAHIEDWAIGGNKDGFSGVFSNPQLLYDGIVKLYSEDVESHWRTFLNSISIGNFGSLSNGNERLLQISGAQSDIARLFGKIAQWSGGFITSDSGVVNEQPFIKFNDDMAFMRQFVNAGLPQYQKYFEEVAKGLEKAAQEKSILGVFSGRNDDPLYATYQYIKNSVLLPLNKSQRAFLEHVLMQPHYRTTILLKPELAKHLNEEWRNVFSVYESSFKNRYPFIPNGMDASFENVMNFFNPESGKLWGTFNNYFKPYITKDRRSRYIDRNTKGMIPVSFSSAFLKCLDHADQISHVFFKDGKTRQWKVTVLPNQTDRIKNALFVLGEQSVEVLTERGKPLKWPVEGEGSIRLTFTNNQGLVGNTPFDGPWSLMRLMNMSGSCSGNVNTARFQANLKTVHNNFKKIILQASVVVSSSPPGTEHPFCRNCFKGFTIPEKAISR